MFFLYLRFEFKIFDQGGVVVPLHHNSYNYSIIHYIKNELLIIFIQIKLINIFLFILFLLLDIIYLYFLIQ